MSHTDQSQSAKLSPDLIKLIATLFLGMIMVMFDTTIVNVALDTLQQELHVPVATIQWVTTGYLLALSMVIPTTVWLKNRFGGRNVWITALLLFTLGSLGAALSWSAGSLIFMRVIMGIGGGVLLPLMQTLLMQSADKNAMGRLSAIIALPAAIGPILGPVLGGVILDSLSWHWIFLINIPLGIIGIAMALRYIPQAGTQTTARLDILGLLLISPALAALIYGLSNASHSGGFMQLSVQMPLIVGIILLTSFVLRGRNNPDALVDLTLFKNTHFSAASASMLFSGIILYAAMLLIPLFAQHGLGLSASVAGYLLLAQGIGTLVSRSPAGLMTDRFGPRWVVFAALVITLIGTLPLAFPIAAQNVWLLGAILFVRGIGVGALIAPIMVGSFRVIEHHQMPHASIIIRTAQQVGGSFGSAVIAVVLETALIGAGSSKMAELSAYETSFWWLIGATVMALFVTFWLPGASQKPVPQKAMASST